MYDYKYLAQCYFTFYLFSSELLNYTFSFHFEFWKFLFRQLRLNQRLNLYRPNVLSRVTSIVLLCGSVTQMKWKLLQKFKIFLVMTENCLIYWVRRQNNPTNHLNRVSEIVTIFLKFILLGVRHGLNNFSLIFLSL